MNTDTINQIGQALDTAFGRPGFTQFALSNLATLNMLADAIRKAHEGEEARKAQAAQETDNG